MLLAGPASLVLALTGVVNAGNNDDGVLAAATGAPAGGDGNAVAVATGAGDGTSSA